MTSNQLTLRQIKELERHNLATEAEERRHNVVSEGYTSEHYARSDEAALKQAWASSRQAEVAGEQLAINAVNAETQRYVAETGRMTYQESVRHNQAYESETNRHNVAQEAEAIKHNRAEESISRQQADIAQYRADIEKQQTVINAGYLAEETMLNLYRAGEIKSQSALNEAKALEAQQNVASKQFQDQLNVHYLELERYKAQLEAARLNLDQYKANLEGLKFKSTQNQPKESKGVFTKLKELGDSVISFLK